LEKHTDIGAGVIDSDYRGSVGIVMFNHGETELVIEKKDRVAQLIIERISMAEFKEVSFSELEPRSVAMEVMVLLEIK